jgi:hypothetical protein
MKTHFLLTAILSIGCLAGAAQTPDQQYQFARQLETDGDAAFALLEYKRFVYHHPGHVKVAEARMNTANIYLFYLADLGQARQSLGEVVKNHKGSATAKAATELVEFIEVNSDFGGKPLLAFLGARKETNRKKHEQAAGGYLKLAATYPQARLAPVALVEAGALFLGPLKQSQRAVDALAKMSPAYVKHEQFAESQFLTAQAIEQLKGPGSEAIAAYKKVGGNDAKNAWRIKALSEATRIEKTRNLPKRVYEKKYVKTFKAVNQATRRDVYIVSIEVNQGLSEREVKATMEDALFQNVGKRQSDKHKVQIAGYFSYPVTKAGSVDWMPGKPAEYTVRKLKTEDAVKGLLFDLSKNR